MILTNARATLGLNATATLGAAGTSGSIQLGPANQTIRLEDSTSGYSMHAVFAGSGDALALDLFENNTTGSTTWVAGTAQVETATIVAAGGCTSDGTMTLVVTAAGMTGSPKNIAVALTTATHTTADLIAAAARTALNADTAYSAMLTAGGTGAAITTTRKPTSTFTVPTGTLNLYAANDGTLNVAIPSGLGVTVASSSANTTSGVVSDGVKIYDGDGNDIEGSDIDLASIFGLELITGSGGLTMSGSGTDEVVLAANEYKLRTSVSELAIDTSYTFTALAATSLKVTVLGA